MLHKCLTVELDIPQFRFEMAKRVIAEVHGWPPINYQATPLESRDCLLHLHGGAIKGTIECKLSDLASQSDLLPCGNQLQAGPEGHTSFGPKGQLSNGVITHNCMRISFRVIQATTEAFYRL